MPAKDLREGDSVVVCTDPAALASSIDPDCYEHIPTPIENVFHSLFVRGTRGTCIVAPTSFHGDGAAVQGNGEVARLQVPGLHGRFDRPDFTRDILPLWDHDVIASILHFEYAGPVYDLESYDLRLFSCGGIIVKNCRCALMPVVPDEGIEPEAEPEPLLAGGITL